MKRPDDATQMIWYDVTPDGVKATFRPVTVDQASWVMTGMLKCMSRDELKALTWDELLPLSDLALTTIPLSRWKYENEWREVAEARLKTEKL